MSEMGDDFRQWRKRRQQQRAKLGEPCPDCIRLLPRAQPKILMPGDVCLVHNYQDPRNPRGKGA